MNEEILDLNIDLSNVDTSFPCLAAGVYPVTVSGAEVVSNKAGTGHNLAMKYALAQEGTDLNGMPVQSGFPLKEWYPLQQSENPNAPDFKRGLALLFKAASMEGESLTKETLAKLIGVDLLAKVKVGEFDGSPTNEIASVRAINA